MSPEWRVIGARDAAIPAIATPALPQRADEERWGMTRDELEKRILRPHKDATSVRSHGSIHSCQNRKSRTFMQSHFWGTRAGSVRRI
jgi:hypothetical protein